MFQKRKRKVKKPGHNSSEVSSLKGGKERSGNRLSKKKKNPGGRDAGKGEGAKKVAENQFG